MALPKRPHGESSSLEVPPQIFDVAVLGNELPGLVAGALLRKRGLQVIHLDTDGAGATYRDAAHHLPYSPALYPSPRHLPFTERVLSELGATVMVQRLFEPGSEYLQLILPGHRVELTPAAGALERELRREWPERASELLGAIEKLDLEAGAALRFLGLLPPLLPSSLVERFARARALRSAKFPTRFMAKRNASGAQSERGDAELFAALDDALTFSTRDAGTKGALAWALPIAHLLRGGARLPGGEQALRLLLRGRMRELGAAMVGGPGEPALVSEMAHTKGLHHLSVVGAKVEVKARVLLAAVECAALMKLLPQARTRGRRWSSLHQEPQDATLTTFNLLLKPGALPPGAGPLFLLGSAATRTAPMLCQVTEAERLDGSGATPLLCVSTAALDAEEPSARMRGIVALLGETLPFIERNVIALSRSPLSGRTRLGPPRDGAHLGLSPRTPEPNLLLANLELLPTLGLEGAFAAGLAVAGHASKLLGKRMLHE